MEGRQGIVREGRQTRGQDRIGLPQPHGLLPYQVILPRQAEHTFPVPPDHESRLARAHLSLDGLSVGDTFGQCFLYPPSVEELIAECARLKPARDPPVPKTENKVTRCQPELHPMPDSMSGLRHPRL